MNDPQGTTMTPKSATSFHVILVAGLVAIALLMMVVLPLTGISVLIPDGAMIGYVMATIAGLILVVAVTLFRARVPPRGASETPEAYWSKPVNAGAAFILWIMTDGAGIIASVGHLLTGVRLTAAVAIAAITSLAYFAPTRLAKH